MKNYSIHLFIMGIFACIVISCDKDHDGGCIMGSPEYVMFGGYYGECVGEGCVEIFKIDFFDKTLAENNDDIYPSALSPYTGENYTILSNEKFNLVKDLIDDIPSQLLDEKTHILGIPDGGDWGGIYFEIRRFGDSAGSGFWLLDQNEDNMPEAYNAFVDRINEKMQLINQ